MANDNQPVQMVATSGRITNVAVTAAAEVLLAAGPLASRKSVRVWAPAANAIPVTVGYRSDLTAGAAVAGQAQGVQIQPGQCVTFSVSDQCLLYVIASATGAVVQVEEVA